MQLDVSHKKAFGDILADYTFTEMHCIDAIGKIENPNVTKIAQTMNLTKAAISKMIKKLLNKNAIEIYKNPENKKEIYYKLTLIGWDVYNKHLTIHENWCNKDEIFFKQFDENELKITFNVLSEYAKALKSRLKSIKEDLK